jgi:hypothetical protein
MSKSRWFFFIGLFCSANSFSVFFFFVFFIPFHFAAHFTFDSISGVGCMNRSTAKDMFLEGGASAFGFWVCDNCISGRLCGDQQYSTTGILRREKPIPFSGDALV